MNKRITLAVTTAFALTAILTGCGNDDDDCEGRGQLTRVTTVSMDGRTTGGSGGRSSTSGGSSGGSSSGGSSASGGSGGKPAPARPKANNPESGTKKKGTDKKAPVKIDDDVFEECDD